MIGEGFPEDTTELKAVYASCYKTYSKLNQHLSNFIVDLLVTATICGVSKGRNVRRNIPFRLRYYLDMHLGAKHIVKRYIIIGAELNPDPELDENDIDLNNYLIPVIRKEDYGRVAGMMLKRDMYETGKRGEYNNFADTFRVSDYRRIERGSWPNENGSGNDAVPVLDADILVALMGLRVLDVRFSDSTIMGQVYYSPGRVELLDKKGIPFRATIGARVILISKDNCWNKAVRNTTIVHECCHMYLHRFFYMLQVIANSRFTMHTNRVNRPQIGKKTETDWMEYQCEKLPAYLFMEEETTREVMYTAMDRHIKEPPLRMLSSVLGEVSSYFNVSRSMAKYRLIDIGAHSFNGISCYANGQAVPDHICSGRWPKGITYTVSAQDAIKCMRQDPSFKKLVTTGVYIYVEGHFCINDKKYYDLKRYGGMSLNEYARLHIDECCIAFRAHSGGFETVYAPGMATRNKLREVDDKYLAKYELVEEPGTARYDEENTIFADDSWLWGELYFKLPQNFRDAVRMILAAKGISYDNLAYKLGVSKRVVTRMLSENSRVSLRHVVGLCVVLQVPYPIADKLIALSGNALTNTYEHYIFMELLVQRERLTIERCDDILRKKNCARLFQSEEIGV